MTSTRHEGALVWYGMYCLGADSAGWCVSVSYRFYLTPRFFERGLQLLADHDGCGGV